MLVGRCPRGGVARSWRGSGGDRPVAAIVALIGLGGLGAGPALAQNAYYENASGTLAVRVQQWGEAYWARVDASGTPAGNAAQVGFSDLISNADLFNPVRAARWTLEDLKVISPSDCDGMETWASVGTGGAVVPAQANLVNAFREAMTEGRFSTDIGSNPEGTQEHAGLILAAPPDQGVIAYQDGDSLVSLNLPLEKVSAPAYAAALQLNLSEQSQAVLATMIASSQGWAAASADRSTEADALVTGTPSKADRFTEIVNNFLSLAGVADRAAVKLHAHFGVFGQLPIVQANLSDCMVLLDPLSGNVSGPFTPDSPLDARGLLGFYENLHVPGSAVRYFSSRGCGRVIAARWHPNPPPAMCDPVPPTGCVWTPFPAPPPGQTRPTPEYFCQIDWLSWGGPGTPAPCKCTLYDIARDSEGRLVDVRQTCSCGSCAGTGTPPGPPPGRFTAPGWAPPATPSPAGTCTCVTDYWY